MSSDPSLIARGAEEFVLRLQARKSLAAYVPYCMEGPDGPLIPALHHRVICDNLDRVIEGVIDPTSPRACKRLIIAAPPGHAKSTYTSHAFAAYAAGRLPPTSSIIATAHTQDFANSWGRKVRNLCESAPHARLFPKGVVKPDDRSVASWSTVGEVSYKCAGVGTTITGRRADILLCDDLLKGIEDANSKSVRTKIRDWYFADAKSRLKPGGAIIIIATRWHEDDLTGELLRMMEEETGESWEYLRMPALCDDPENDPTGRALGEPLWPAWQDRQALLEIKEGGIDNRSWECLYQQNPIPSEGTAMKRDWIRRMPLPGPETDSFKELIRHSMIYQSWDTANAATNRSDPSACGTFMVTPKLKEYRLIDVYRAKRELPDLRKDAIDLARKVKKTFGRLDAILIENKATGQSLASFLQRDLPFNIILQDPKKLGDKEFRFERCTPVIEAHRLIVPHERGEPRALISPGEVPNRLWVKEYIDELVAFPAGRNDDQVDFTSQMINWYEGKKTRGVRSRKVSVG